MKVENLRLFIALPEKLVKAPGKVRVGLKFAELKARQHRGIAYWTLTKSLQTAFDITPSCRYLRV